MIIISDITYLKKYSDVDFRTLPFNKRIDLLTKLYLSYCTNLDLFLNKKINPKYFPLRKHFEKQEDTQVNVLFDYVISLETKKILSLSDFYTEAEKYRQQCMIAEEKNKTLSKTKYKDLLDCLEEM